MFLISAGHHPYAKGASYGDFNEFDEAVIWQRKIIEYLDGRGGFVPHGKLKNKVAFINSQEDVEVAVEIHFNAASDKNGNPVGKGSEVLIYPGSEEGAAVGKQVAMRLGLIYEPNRGVKDGWYRMNPDNGPDFFLSKTNCTALIVEPEFVHNYEKIQEGRDAGCTMIAEALLDYYGG